MNNVIERCPECGKQLKVYKKRKVKKYECVCGYCYLEEDE